MQIVLAWILYLVLGTACVVLGWAWLGPRLPGRVRQVALVGVAATALVALGVTARMPHDYRTEDFGEYLFGFAAISVELLAGLAGLVAGLLVVGRRRVQSAHLFGAGVYLAGSGVVLYVMLGGLANMQAALLVFLGSSLTMASALRLAGLPRWAARSLGPAAGLAVAFGAEALRGMGSHGEGPAAASRDVWALTAISGALLLAGAVYFVRSQGRVLARPLAGAAAGIAATWLALALRGPGEWAPGPHASSTTLYGLPLTLLALAIALAILEMPAYRILHSLWPAWPALVVLLPVVMMAAVWRPASDPCSVTPYADSSRFASAPAWAISPDPTAPRGAPDVAEFRRLCSYTGASPGQLVYTIDPGCKWTQIDASYPLVQASGTLRTIVLSNEDSPWIHTSHDLGLDMAVDAGSAWTVLGGGVGSLLHVEAESGPFPVDYRPVEGDRLTVAGRWIFDCGHEPKTEIHPAAVVANEHEEWRADVQGTEGVPQFVHVLQVWMNGAPGVVRSPLAPFSVQAGFPSAPAGHTATPLVQVVAGDPGAVKWSVDTSSGAPQASVRVTPPSPDGSAYFEILLGYKEASSTPAIAEPLPYIVAFDSMAVHDDLHRAARNTTGFPAGLTFPGLGFAGNGHWTMQLVADHSWRTLLNDAPVASGGTYSLRETVPPVHLLAPRDDHLHMAVTGYAENDPSAGVGLASGSVGGPSMLTWDAGPLSSLCCNKLLTYTPQHGAWTLSYYITMVIP